TTFDQIQHRQAIDDNKVLTDHFTGTAYDFNWETDAVCIASTPFIITMVGTRGDKFVNQIAFRTHDFYAVITGILSQLGTIGKIINGLLHFSRSQSMRFYRIDWCLNWGWRDIFSLIRIASGMQNLHGN